MTNFGMLLTLISMVCVSGMGSANSDAASARMANADESRSFFAFQNKAVLTFVGYSGAGYQDPKAMISIASSVLRDFDPKTTIVNLGATKDGIGAVYQRAKEMGFVTTGIVSTQARSHDAELSPYVDHVFFVKDKSWGGIGADGRLSPTSSVMVENSTVMVGIGGGEIARDELTAAKRLGKEVRYFPADMDHQRSIEKARKQGRPPPTDFGGTAAELFAEPSNSRNSE